MNLELIHESLRELSDEVLQSALWTGKSDGEQSSFTEAVCVLFNDAGLEKALNSGNLDKDYSKSLCRRARQLLALVNMIDDTGTPEQTLGHAKMDALRDAARELMELFTTESRHQTPGSPPA